MILGHQKGNDTKENIARNFGMARPEGYRKAERLMRQAEKFGFPVISFIDTPGAEPGIGSEERGQATAIAESLLTMAGLGVPTVAVIIGEGGSGGALAIGVADRILMLENAIYAVASPEAFATILWRDAARASEAAETMRITAADLADLGIVDEVIPEYAPAHERPREAMRAAGEAIGRHLQALLRDFPPGDPAASERLRAVASRPLPPHRRLARDRVRRQRPRAKRGDRALDRFLFAAEIDPAMTQGIDDRLRAVVDLQLAQDRGDVVFHRLIGDVQDAGDLLVAQSLRDKPQDLDLARAERRGSRRPRLRRAARRSALPRGGERRQSWAAARRPGRQRRAE